MRQQPCRWLLAPESALAQEELTQLQKMKALSPGEAATISAFCERLIPSDATGPGAREANVIRYIDRALAGDLAMFRSSYTAAAVSLDAYSQSKYGAAFADAVDQPTRTLSSRTWT